MARVAGFTLMEFVITIMLIGILSSAVLLNLNLPAQHGVTVQADQLRRDISHIQSLAISQGARLKLTVAVSGYTVCAASASPCNSGSARADPATGEPFSVVLTDGVAFTQGSGDYYFDSFGRPVSAATGNTLVSGVSTFRLKDASRSTPATVTVLPITGFAQIVY